jgi:hypothetical protein
LGSAAEGLKGSLDGLDGAAASLGEVPGKIEELSSAITTAIEKVKAAADEAISRVQQVNNT